MKYSTFSHKISKVFLSITILFCYTLSFSQTQPMQNMSKDTLVDNKAKPVEEVKNEMEIPHPFFTHEGMPEEQGMTSIRASALATTDQGNTTGDFAFHIESSLSKNVGLHIRNDRFLFNTHTEIMFQFAAIRSKDGKSGFAPIIEFEIPTKKGANRINSLIGFTTKFVRPRFVINQVIHYNPREDMLDGSIGLVYNIAKNIYLVGEVLGDKADGEAAMFTLVGGIKFRLRDNFLIGFGYQGPASKNREFSSQYILQPEYVINTKM